MSQVLQASGLASSSQVISYYEQCVHHWCHAVDLAVTLRWLLTNDLTPCMHAPYNGVPIMSSQASTPASVAATKAGAETWEWRRGYLRCTRSVSSYWDLHWPDVYTFIWSRYHPTEICIGLTFALLLIFGLTIILLRSALAWRLHFYLVSLSSYWDLHWPDVYTFIWSRYHPTEICIGLTFTLLFGLAIILLRSALAWRLHFY